MILIEVESDEEPTAPSSKQIATMGFDGSIVVFTAVIVVVAGTVDVAEVVGFEL